MKTRILAGITICMAMSSFTSAADDWKSRYGLEGCDNPVFVRPQREVPGGRVDGAGINMNDGEAYLNTFFDLSGEWHYAPKLSFSEKEYTTLHRVIGFAAPKSNSDNYDYGRIIKFNVKRINGCMALAVYRTGFDSSEPVTQYIATYDASGNLVDAMMMGDENTVDDLFKVEPHGDYTLRGHWANIEGVVDENNPARFTVTLRNHYYIGDKGVDWKMTRYYHVDKSGYILLDSISRENQPQFNTTAAEMIEMTLTPLASGYDKVMTTLNKIQPQLTKSEQGTRVQDRQVERMFAWNPQAFLTWVWRQPKCNLNEVIHRKVKSDCYVGQVFNPVNFAGGIETVTNTRARRYWISMLQRWNNED